MTHLSKTLGTLAMIAFLILPSARAAESTVTWPSLKKLDDLAEKCEALSESKNVPELRKIAAEVKASAATVAGEAVPKNAKLPDQVKILQSDLKSLTDSIEDPKKQDGEELTALLAGVHPIVEKLMEAAGMPHVHEADEKEAPKK
jgi:hypothetical protein